MRMIQERWVGGNWKDVERARGDGQLQLEKLRKDFAECRAIRPDLTDAEFRLVEVDPDLTHKLLELIDKCPKPIERHNAFDGSDDYRVGLQDGEAQLAQKIRDLLHA